MSATRKPDRSTRRASGTVRALVLGGTTLAITVVCFSIYEFAQQSDEPQPSPQKKRIPEVPTSIPHEFGTQEEAPGVSIGSADSTGRFDIGQGRDITLHLYASEGADAVMEIAVENYTPVRGSTNEFHLTRPEIRLNANDGRGVKVTAESGILEASRKGVGTLDPQRGRLDGDVLILIDRLSPAETAKLPEADRLGNQDARIIRVEADAIEFDLGYSKIIVPPGRLRITANDIDFTASGLEVRFDESRDRIDYLRIEDSARLELRSAGSHFGVQMPGTGSQPDRKTSWSNWFRETLLESLAASEQQSTAPPKNPAGVQSQGSGRHPHVHAWRR